MVVVETIGRIRREHLVSQVDQIVRALEGVAEHGAQDFTVGRDLLEYQRLVQPRPKLGAWQ